MMARTPKYIELNIYNAKSAEKGNAKYLTNKNGPAQQWPSKLYKIP